MAYTRNWDETTPPDHTAKPDTPLKMREIKTDVAERLKNFFYGFTSGETDTAAKKVTFKEQSSDPSSESDCAIIYAKEVSGVTEIFVEDSAGNIKQITSGGKLNVASDEAVLLTGDQTVAGVKTFSSIPVGPSSDPSSDNQLARKKYVDDQITTVDNKIGFGSYESKLSATDYTASTDGFVIAYAYHDDWAEVHVTVAGSIVCRSSGGTSSSSEYAGITVPVKSGDTWKVEGTGTITVYWVAIGT